MSELVYTNVVLTIVSGALLIIIALAGVALYYFIKILMVVRRLAEQVEAGSQTLAQSIDTLRTQLIGSGVLAGLLQFFVRRAQQSASRQTTNTHKDADTG